MEVGHHPGRVFLDQQGNFHQNGGRLYLSTASVAAAGTGQGDAAPVESGFTLATGADGFKGVVLPEAEAGLFVLLKNDEAAAAVLKVFPASGASINALAVDASLDLAAGTSVLLVALDSSSWFSLPLLPS